MNTITIPCFLARAGYNDVFEAWGVPKNHIVYFFHKPDLNTYHGPFCMNEYYDVASLKVQLGCGMLYLISTIEDGFSFLMTLREAQLDDLRDGRYLRNGYTYYVMEDDGEEHLEGPFYLNPNTNKDILEDQLNAKALYIVAEKQDFTPYDVQHSA